MSKAATQKKTSLGLALGNAWSQEQHTQTKEREATNLLTFAQERRPAKTTVLPHNKPPI